MSREGIQTILFWGLALYIIHNFIERRKTQSLFSEIETEMNNGILSSLGQVPNSASGSASDSLNSMNRLQGMSVGSTEAERRNGSRNGITIPRATPFEIDAMAKMNGMQLDHIDMLIGPKPLPIGVSPILNPSGGSNSSDLAKYNTGNYATNRLGVDIKYNGVYSSGDVSPFDSLFENNELETIAEQASSWPNGQQHFTVSSLGKCSCGKYHHRPVSKDEYPSKQDYVVDNWFTKTGKRNPSENVGPSGLSGSNDY